jgi:hypothetical protein
VTTRAANTGIGSTAWAQSTQGRLSRGEQLAYFRQGVASLVANMSDAAAFALGLRRDRIQLDLETLTIPDTQAAREAEEVCRQLPPFMVEHSHRSYIWGAALAAGERLDYDHEFLYCASLLHDAGLFDASANDSCFTLASARRAVECAERGGWDADRRDRLSEAITLHINPVVPPEQTVEGHLLATGSTLDALALRRRWRIHPDTLAAVVERHPRHHLKSELKALLKQHARAFPRGRIGFLWRYGGLPMLVSAAPFKD